MRALLCFARRGLLPIIILMLGLAATYQSASAQTDVIRGRVTNSDGQALPGVRVTATSIPGNVTRTATTNNQGSFQIAFPGGPGDYIMGYALFGYAFRQFQVKRLADEEVLVADARLLPIQLDSLVVTATRQERVNRNQTTPDVSGTERAVTAATLPIELQGDIAAMAASLPGVLLLPGIDGAQDAFSVFGLSGDQNSVTLNGMQTGSNSLPRDAAITSSLSTSPFDVSRGGFSGGNFNIRSRPGSNFRTRGMSLVATSPQVQWTDRAAQALGNDYTNISLGGVASGPLQLNKSFYNVSFQLGRQARDNQTLLNTSELGLQTAGIAMDSVDRFIGILQNAGVPVGRGASLLHSNRLSDNGSVFGSIDISPPGSSSGQSFGFNFNGSWRQQTPAVGGATQLETAGGDRTNWSGGLQARHSGYFGLILSESSAGVNMSRDFGDAYLDLPSGRVRVSSLFADGTSGVQNLSFGGNQGMSNTTGVLSASFMNTLSWFDNANKHRLKFTTELQFNGNTQDQSSNLLGTFAFNSLEDLQAGRPSMFTRTLSGREFSTGQLSGAVSIGDTYRHTQDLQFQYGLRVDASHYTTAPQYNALVEQLFGRSNADVPTPISFSPRIGFSYTLGSANEIALFTGAVRGPRAVVRGGIGVFANNPGSGLIQQALLNTGLPSGVQQITCVGSAVPIPNWLAYTDPANIPETCADGSSGSVFSNSSPNVTLFAEDFSPQKTVRSNLSWNGGILDARFMANLEATYSLNLNQQRTLDLNFRPDTRFTLADDGRPVFVAVSSIVPATGSTASRDARVTQSFARVNELRSDLKSQTAQLSLRISPIPRTPTRFGWSAAYTYSHIREQFSGFSSTAGNPLSLEWARSGQGPHQINYSLRYRFFDAVDVSWTGSLRSGSAFTPLVAGDINGDGYSNDRAFIFAPNSANDAALAAGMSDLLENSTGGTRKCLEEQLGKIAGRNSCRGPWSSTASLNITLDRAKFRMPDRASLSFSLANPLGAADLLLHGSGNLKGWGQTPFPDQSLLYVRGFDAATRQYKYEVNQRFGATRPQFVTLRSPVMLTMSMRYDLGPTRERETLAQQLRPGRTQTGTPFPESMFRQFGSSALLNPMSTILRSQDSLRLTALQADSIASMNRRYTYRADSLWTPVAKFLASLPNKYDDDAAYIQYLNARRKQVDMLTEVVRAVRELLTSEQRRKLPPQIINQLDPRYLALIRDGNRLYLGSAGGPSFIGIPDAGMMMMGGAAMEAATIMIRH